MKAPDTHSALQIGLKALILFVIFNALFMVIFPMDSLGRVSAYNIIFPGRQRLPYGDNPEQAYNLSTYNLEAMFASHEISAGVKNPAEYRVVLIGDSSTWGWLLKPEQTLPAYLNQAGYSLSDGHKVKVYNLGYPVMSLMKDLTILSKAMDYQPDLVIWLLTLESFPLDKQLFPPLLQNNPGPVQRLIRAYDIPLDADDPNFVEQTRWQRTIIGQRRSLADLIRLQLYGVLWAATGIDQFIPDDYTPRMEDLPADTSFHDLKPPHLHRDQIALDVLKAGALIANQTPVLFINEPMFISKGQHSEIRYNFYYPRWAYDDYRLLIAQEMQNHGWNYLDLWDAIPASEFTNSAIHLSPNGSQLFAELIGEAILNMAE